MLRSSARGTAGLVSFSCTSISALAIIAVLSALGGCWDASGSGNSAATTPQLASISVSPPDSSAAAGSAQQLTATGIYSDGSKQVISSSAIWKSSGIAIATINAAGMATALSAGSTTITATDGAIAGSTTLTVTSARLVSIEVTPAAPSIALGTTRQFKATGVYSDRSSHDVTASVSWQSGTPTIAAINSAGLATASSAGTTLVTATLAGVTSVAVTLRVTAATLVSIVVTPTTAAIVNGTQQQFTAMGIYSDRSKQDLSSTATWSSSGSTVATIANTSGSHGLATATGVGSASITAALSGVTSPAVTLTVSAATLVSIAVTPTTPSLALGLNQQLTATGTYTDHSTQNVTSAVTWTSSAISVADISSGLGTSGLVTSHSVGSTNIKATLGAVSSSPVALAVTAATLIFIGVTPAVPSIALGTGEQFTAIGIYTDNSIQNLTTLATWGSSSGAVASVSNASGSNGLATSLTAGSTTITAIMGSVTSNPVMLTVTSATLVSIAVTPAASTIALGTGQLFTATGTYTDHSTQDLTTSATWVSLNGSVVSISNASGSNGWASSVATGSTTITAASGAVTSSPATLTVTAAALVSITVTPAAPSIAAGTSQQFMATGSYADNSTEDLTTQVTWASDNPNAATISNQGLASSAAQGSADISAMMGSVNSAPVTLTVTAAALVSIAITPAMQSIEQGTNQQFTAIGTFSDDSTQNLTTSVTWVSSSTAVASISNAGGSNGLGTSLTVGTTSISAAIGSLVGSTSWMVLAVHPWTVTGSLNTARMLHTATLFTNGAVLVAGGWDSSLNPTSSAEVYDPNTTTWIPTGSMNVARVYHTATLLPNGTVLVAAGQGPNGGPFPWMRMPTTLSSAEIYDPIANSWTLTGSLNNSRAYHTATLLPNGTVLVAGGQNPNNYAMTSAEIYDPNTNSWTPTGSMNAPRINSTAILLPDGTVLVEGGQSTNGSITSSAEIYNPSTNSWTLTGSLNTARTEQTATLLPNGTVLIAAGQDQNGDDLTSAEIYNPSTNSWTPTGSLNTGRGWGLTQTLLPNGTVLVAGGIDSNYDNLSSAEIYDPNTSIWTPTGSLNDGRRSHTATLLLNGTVLAVGGAGQTGVLASAELY
jgi:trimeric autotransporter adhesin